MISSARVPCLQARKSRFVVQLVTWAGAMVVLLMLVSRIESNSDEEIDISARRLRKNEDDADSGYPFADALIKYPYRQSNNNKWAIIFHVLGICYMMLGLNIVCDAYFCEALTCMCSAWNIQEDVAGATFMAAGGSAPEFFTSIMGVFVAKSDVGFGTIVGSAVFNVLFVIGLCAAASSVPLKLTWWPLFRDCSYYCFGLIVLSIFVWDEKVAAHEAAILFLMYLGYITIMYYNSTLEKKVKDWLAKRSAKVQTEPVSEEPVAGNTEEVLQIALPGMNAANDMVLSPVTPASSSDENNNAAAVEEEPHNVKVERRKSDVKEALEAVRRYSKSFEERRAKPGNGDDDGDNDDDNDDDEEPRGNPFVELWNETDSKERVLRFLAIPIVFPLWLTVPDCTTDKWKNYFMRTFSASILWIALFSYFLVWWATIVGDVIGVPTVVMGLTVLAAGTSIPDAISSVVMARLGQGDMAVSSSIGSNVFDILVGLPIPWFLKTAIVCPLSRGSLCTVPVLSPYLVINVIVLLSMVLAVVVSIHLSDWVLTKQLGIVMAVLYAVFLSFAITIEITKP